MLHHHFRKVNDLLFLSGIHEGPCISFAEAYDACKEACVGRHEADGLDNPFQDLETDEDDLAVTSDDPEEDDMNVDWTDLAAHVNRVDGATANPDEVLGFRSIDRDSDWGGNFGTYPDLTKDWYTVQKGLHPVVGGTHGGVVPYGSLEAKQK